MRMRVRRSGGFAGLTRSGEVDLGDVDQPDVRAFVDAVRIASAASQPSAPDTFVYHVTFDDEPELTVGERALSAATRHRIDAALD